MKKTHVVMSEYHHTLPSGLKEVIANLEGVFSSEKRAYEFMCIDFAEHYGKPFTTKDVGYVVTPMVRLYRGKGRSVKVEFDGHSGFYILDLITTTVNNPWEMS